MTEVVRFELAEGAAVLVEVDEDNLGIERVSRGRDGVVEAGHRLTEALGSVRDAARESMEVLRTLSPGRMELEFGVKLAAEAGAIIAKTAAEGHFTVRLTWAPDAEASNGSQIA
ncbi:MAG: CU044_2847 family protein [Pseudonocardiaceae bacterium]